MLQNGAVPGGGIYVSIDFRCDDGFVSQHFLDYSKICPVFYKVSGKGVAECVRRDFLAYSGYHCLLFHHIEY